MEPTPSAGTGVLDRIRLFVRGDSKARTGHRGLMSPGMEQDGSESIDFVRIHRVGIRKGGRIMQVGRILLVAEKSKLVKAAIVSTARWQLHQVRTSLMRIDLAT